MRPAASLRFLIVQCLWAVVFGLSFAPGLLPATALCLKSIALGLSIANVIGLLVDVVWGDRA